MNKVYSLDTYRQLLKENRTEDLVFIQIVDQNDLDNHYRNIELIKEYDLEDETEKDNVSRL